MPIDFPSLPTSGQVYSYNSRSWMYNGTGWQSIAYLTSGSVVSGSLAYGTVFSGNIASGQVGWPHIASGAITSGDIASGAVVSDSIASGQITGNKIAASTIANVNLVASTITIAGSSTSLGGSWTAAALTTSSGLLAGTYYPSGSLTIGIASGGVIAQMMASGSVLSGSIASGQIGASHLASGTLQSAPATLQSGQVTSGFLGNASVVSGSIASGQVSRYHIADLSIFSGHISSNEIGAIHLASGAVTSGKIGNAAVTSGNIASGQIGQMHLSSGAVNSGHVGQFAIANINIISGTIANDKLAFSSITIAGSNTALGGSWAAAALTTSSGLLANTYYPSGSLTIGIASGGITSQMIADGAVLSGDVGSASLGGIHIASGSLTGTNLAASTIANANLVASTITIAGSSTALGGSWPAAALTTASGLLAGTYYPSGSLTIGIASGGVVAQMMASGSVLSGNIASGQVGQYHHASGSVTSGHIGQFAVANINIISGTVANDKLAFSSITIAGSNTALGGSWAAAALTTASGLLAGTYYPSGSLTIGIASGGVVAQMMASGSVLSGSIASGQIGASHLASGTLQSAPATLTSGQVTSGFLGNASVVSGSIASGQVGTFHHQTASILSGQIGANVIGSPHILAGSITNTSLQNSAVTIAGSSTSLGGSWAAAALTTSSGLLAGNYYPSGALTIGIASGGITNQMLADGSVTSGDIASGQIGINHLASGVISTATLGSGQVKSGNIASGSVGQFALSSGAVNSGHVGNNTVVSGSIASGSIGSFHISSGTYVTNTNRFPVATSGLYYIDLAASLSGSAGTFTSSGLVFNPRSGGTLGIGDVTNPSSRLTVTHSSLYPGQSLQVNTTTIAQYSGGVTSGSTTYANDFTLGVDRGSVGLTAYAARFYTYGYFTGSLAPPPSEYGALYANVGDIGGSSAPTTYGIRIQPGSNSYDSYGLYVGGGGASSTNYGIYVTATGYGGTGNWGIYAEASNTGGTRPAIAAQFKIAGNVTHYARGLVVDSAVATISRDYYGAIIDATNITALSGKIALYVSDGTSTATFGNGSGGAALFTGGNVGIRTTTPSGTLHVETGSATRIGTIIRGFTSQTANLTEWQDSANTVYARVNASGEFWGLIASGIVTSGDLGNASVISGSIASGQIGQMHLSSGAVNSGHLAQFAIANINIISGTIANDKLANSTITIAGSSTTLGGTWTAAALTTSSGLLAGTYYPSGSLTIGVASGGLTAQMHASGSILSGHIGNNAVVSGSIASGQVSTPHIAAGSVLSGQIGANVIGSPHILAGSITNTSLQNSAITIAGASTSLGGTWAAAALTTASGLLAGTYYPSGALTIGVASGGINSSHIASGAVVSGDIGNSAVVSGSIASGSIGGVHLASGALGIAGSSGQIQFNAGGTLGASAAVTFSSGTSHLNVNAQATNIIPLKITVNSGHSATAFQIIGSGSLQAAAFDATGVLYCSQYTGAGTNTLINATIPDNSMQRSVIIGQGAFSASGQVGELVAIGYSANANRYGVAVGQSASAAANSIALGLNSTASNTGVSIAIGQLANAAYGPSCGLGPRATPTANGDFVWASETSNPTFRLQRMSSTNANRYLFALAGTWIDSTDATHTSRVTLSTTYAGSSQEAIRIDSASDLARVGIGGAASGRLCVYTGAAANKGLVIQGFTSQSANYLEIQNSAQNSILSFTNSGNLAVGTMFATYYPNGPAARLHVRAMTISGNTVTSPWPSLTPDTHANWRDAAIISDGGNGETTTLGTGTTCGITLGEYYTGRIVIQPYLGGSSSPVDQAARAGRDMMLKGGASDNTTGSIGGRLFLQGGVGFTSTGFDGNVGAVSLQPLAGQTGIGTSTPSGTLNVVSTSGNMINSIFRGFTSQNANLIECQDSSFNVVASVNRAGGYSSRPNTTALTASQNNYAFDGSSIQRVSSNGNYNITGITYPSGLSAHSAGRFIRLYNINAAGGNSITLVHNSSSSSTGNKFWNVLLTDIVLGPLDYAELIYDDTDNGSGSAGWRVH